MTDEQAVERRSFKMHDKLLLDVITRQAGSLEKAVAEAVMNSIDAKATRIDVKLTATKVLISDNGEGFKDRESLIKVFEVFGQPHSEEEGKIYGTFRMGRGQGFAFGRNVWRSGEFEMEVDIRKTFLDYDLKSGLKHQPGCSVMIELYSPIASYSQRWVHDEIVKMVKYVTAEVRINDEVVNTDPRTKKWSYETDDAWIDVTDARYMRVYNLGVYTNERAAGDFGAGGTVVSKKQFKMNFARNDIINDCEIWKRVKSFVHDKVDSSNKDKGRLTEAGRMRLADKLRTGLLTPIERYQAPVFKDAIGRWWSVEKMIKSQWRFDKKISMGDPKEDRRGDRMMQMGLCLVLDSSWAVHHFGVKTLQQLIDDHILPAVEDKSKWKFEQKAFEDVVGTLGNSFELVDAKKWSPIEQAVVNSVVSAQRHFVEAMKAVTGGSQNPRKIAIGKSGAAEGWTDGSTYIAIERDWLRKNGTDMPGFVKLGLLIAHEYCHDSESGTGHVHDDGFHQYFHDLVNLALDKFVDTAFANYGKYIVTAGKRLTRAQLAERDRLAAQAKKTDAVVAQMTG